MHPCCEKPENRETIEQKGDITVQKCKVCDRKHYELSVDPGVVGIEVK